MNRLAVAGNEGRIFIYDEETPEKHYLMTLKAGGPGLPNRVNRIFTVKFDREREHILYSGGWDNTVYISDLRAGYDVGAILGPHVCGDSIDVAGNFLIAGSYRNEKNLLLYDLRHTSKPFQFLELDSHGASNNHYSESMVYAAQFYK